MRPLLSVQKDLHQRNVVIHSPPILPPIRGKKSQDHRCFSRQKIILPFKTLLFWFGNFFIYSHLLTFIVAIYLIGVCELYFGLVFYTHVRYDQKTAALVKTLTSASGNILFWLLQLLQSITQIMKSWFELKRGYVLKADMTKGKSRELYRGAPLLRKTCSSPQPWIWKPSAANQVRLGQYQEKPWEIFMVPVCTSNLEYGTSACTAGRAPLQPFQWSQ